MIKNCTTFLLALSSVTTTFGHSQLDWFTSPEKNIFNEAVSGLTDEQEDLFVMGRSFFAIPWVTAPSVTTARDGLGPLFNANTCQSCHLGYLNAPVLRDNGQPTRALVFKLSKPSQHGHKKSTEMVVIDSTYGDQIAINGAKNVPFEATPHIVIKTHSVSYPDGETLMLRQFIPQLKQLNYGNLDKNTQISIRQAPALLGLGLLSQLSDEQILANADPNDNDQDGISGRPNQVFDPVSQSIKLGRFGHKATKASLLFQTADAAANDMGLTNPLFPHELCTEKQTDCSNAPIGRKTAYGHLDLPQHRLNAITFHVAHLKSPQANSKHFTQQQKRGAELFNTIGCLSCHTDTFTTPAGVTFHPYTDLLLHDMGNALGDRPEFAATANEWRTAPLMGTGAKVRNQRQFLHDGRARTPEEAILWHAGEAKQTIEQFKQLSRSDRQALLSFLEAL